MKQVILTTLKNELDILERYVGPYMAYGSMLELQGFNIVVDFQTSANMCHVLGEIMDLGNSITDIIVTHSDIERTWLDASDLDDEMVITLLEKAELTDYKNTLI